MGHDYSFAIPAQNLHSHRQRWSTIAKEEDNRQSRQGGRPNGRLGCSVSRCRLWPDSESVKALGFLCR
jgi:hypothetical protein